MEEQLEVETIEQGKGAPNPSPAGTGGISPGDTADRSFRQGINKERKRTESHLESELARYDVKLVKDDKGRVNIAESLSALVRAGQPEAAAALQQQYAGRIAELSQQNERLSQDLQRTRITTAVREKITRQNPMNLDDSTDLFLLRYIIKLDDESGEFVVCDKAGNPIHHKITANPLTIEDAVEQFFADRPGLREQSKGNGLQGLGSLKGSPGRARTNEDLSDQYVEALNAGDHATASRLKAEMKKQIKVSMEA